MRKFITLMAVVATIIFLAAGHFYWKEKTSAHAPAMKESSKSGEVNAKKKADESVEVDTDVLELTATWPDQARDSFERAVADGKVYKIAFVGSEALGENDGGWSVMLKDAIGEAYGDAVEVDIFEYAERSDEFISNGDHKEVAKFKPDFVLFEPFTLNDNGNLEVEENHENIKTFMSAVKKENDGAVFVLQPPYPIHGATFYPAQVEELEKFANEEGYVYLNHWSEWPDQEDEELRSYLKDKQSVPNEKGHEVWFNYLEDFFIAE